VLTVSFHASRWVGTSNRDKRIYNIESSGILSKKNATCAKPRIESLAQEER